MTTSVSRDLHTADQFFERPVSDEKQPDPLCDDVLDEGGGGHSGGSALINSSSEVPISIGKQADPLYEDFQKLGDEGTVIHRLQTLYEKKKNSLDDSDRSRFDALAVDLLRQEIFFNHSYESISSLITSFHSIGLPLKDEASIYDPLLDQFAAQWTEKVAFFRDSWKGIASFEALNDSIEERFEELKCALAHDGMQWSGGDNELRKPIERKLVHVQCQTLISFMSYAISAHLPLLHTATLSQREQRTILEWLDAISKDCTSYASDPFLAENASLAQLLSHIQELQKTVSKAPVKQGILCVAGKVAHVAKRIFVWLPTALFYLVPMILSAIAGYKAGGVKGATIATGVATATSVLTLCSGCISEKVVKELVRFQSIPESFFPVVKAITGFAIRIQIMLLTMQANGLLSGMISQSYSTHTKPDGLWSAGVNFGSASIDVPVKITTLAMKDLSLVRSVLYPDVSSGTIAAVSDVFHAQIEASVASYRLGEAFVRLPVAATQIFQAIS